MSVLTSLGLSVCMCSLICWLFKIVYLHQQCCINMLHVAVIVKVDFLVYLHLTELKLLVCFLCFQGVSMLLIHIFIQKTYKHKLLAIQAPFSRHLDKHTYIQSVLYSLVRLVEWFCFCYCCCSELLNVKLHVVLH